MLMLFLLPSDLSPVYAQDQALHCAVKPVGHWCRCVNRNVKLRTNRPFGFWGYRVYQVAHSVFINAATACDVITHVLSPSCVIRVIPHNGLQYGLLLALQLLLPILLFCEQSAQSQQAHGCRNTHLPKLPLAQRDV
jgi:hypothetical protein